MRLNNMSIVFLELFSRYVSFKLLLLFLFLHLLRFLYNVLIITAVFLFVSGSFIVLMLQLVI